MHVLVPVDGSDPSLRAVGFGADLVDGLGGRLDVVHVTESETEATAAVVADAREALDATGIDADPEVLSGADLDVRPENRVGECVVDLVRERGYDHVVMGHHGAGAAERAMLGSAAETVVRADEVSVTVVP